MMPFGDFDGWPIWPQKGRAVQTSELYNLAATTETAEQLRKAADGWDRMAEHPFFRDSSAHQTLRDTAEGLRLLADTVNSRPFNAPEAWDDGSAEVSIAWTERDAWDDVTCDTAMTTRPDPYGETGNP